MQEVPNRKQYRRRIAQEMDPTDNKRADTTDGHELNQPSHCCKDPHDDTGAQKPLRGARPEGIADPPKGNVGREGAHEETDRKSHEHGMDWMAENGGGAWHPAVIRMQGVSTVTVSKGAATDSE